MLKTKFFATTTLIAAMFGAGAAAAAQNPLQPNHPTYAAALSFAPNSTDVAIAASPLQPNFYDRNVATPSAARSVEVVTNNPLQPGFKRS